MQVVDGGQLKREVQPLTEVLWTLGDAGGYVQSGATPESMSWSTVRDRAATWAGALRKAGIRKGDRVAILADTSRDWMVANHAIHALGAVVVPIYPTLQADVVSHILKDSGAKLLFADPDQAPKLKGLKVKTWTFAKVPEGPAIKNPVACKLSDPALLIYTSGTTGVPKGVLLDHRNVAGDVQAAIQGESLDTINDPSLVAFLPLAHIAGYVSLHALMALGGTVYFSRPDRMGEDLQRFRPTIALAVPRLWDRIVRKVEEAVAAGSPVKRFLYGRAKAVAIAWGKAADDGGTPGAWLRLRHGFYGKLLYRKLLDKLGMDNVQIAITGAAAVRKDLLWFLRGIGLPIIEGYGMTESSALTTATLVDDWKAGTVGTPLPGCKIAIDDDGEVLIGGIGVFQEYWRLPQETAETRVMIDGEPWIRSGDIGTIQGGRLAIVDRKKELEVLDTGKMIAPVRVEELLKSASSYVEDSLLVGTDRPFAAMLIQPSYDSLIRWAASEGIEADEVIRKMAPTGEEQAYGVGPRLLSHPKVQALFQTAIDTLNARVADFERVRKWTLVPHAFTLDRGELTPSFKKKRKVILANYRNQVESLFGPRSA